MSPLYMLDTDTVSLEVWKASGYRAAMEFAANQ